jgi:DNA/RNA endonuclease YhcR with UshA esterase domain
LLLFFSKPEKLQRKSKKFLFKKVRVFGKVKEYQGKPEIILENQNQIEVLE